MPSWLRTAQGDPARIAAIAPQIREQLRSA
jgi:hypothetical protein